MTVPGSADQCALARWTEYHVHRKCRPANLGARNEGVLATPSVPDAITSILDASLHLLVHVIAQAGSLRKKVNTGV